MGSSAAIFCTGRRAPIPTAQPPAVTAVARASRRGLHSQLGATDPDQFVDAATEQGSLAHNLVGRVGAELAPALVQDS